MAAKKKSATKTAPKTSVAKEKDGSIQITFTIPFKDIESARKEAAEELGKNVEVPGFRKGKAPLKKLIEHIPDNALIEHTLSRILPGLVGEAIKEHNLKLAIYPRFELIRATEGDDWQVRALSAEIPEIDLGNYKKEIAGAARAEGIWTPDKAGKTEKDKEPSSEEKEQAAINALLKSVKLDVPKVLIDEEVNSRVSQLLSRLEKLGLDLESYLSSLGKTAETLRKEYEAQASEAIKLDLALNKIAEEEKIEVDEKEVKEALDARHAGHDHPENHEHSPEEKRMVTSILRRRAALDSLVALI
mgnify:CR=1 FL=1